MNIVLRRFDGYAGDAERILGTILTLKSDDTLLTREDLYSLNNRCYYVETSDGKIIGIVVGRYYGPGQEVILGEGIGNTTAFRDEHYTIQYLLFDNYLVWDSYHINMFDVVKVLLREVCVDTNDKVVLIDFKKQCTLSMSNPSETTSMILTRALLENGFGQWVANQNIWMRVMPLNFNDLHSPVRFES